MSEAMSGLYAAYPLSVESVLRGGRAGGVPYRPAPFLHHHGEQHGYPANQASDESDDDLAIGQVKSVRHHEKSEQIEGYSHHDSRGVILDLLKHCPVPAEKSTHRIRHPLSSGYGCRINFSGDEPGVDPGATAVDAI
jgi:hypothetical protein